jgi:hypothetical protein
MDATRKEFMEKQSQSVKEGWMKGHYFMPHDGYCYSCRADVVKLELERGNDGSGLVTGCPKCHTSYCD